MAAVSATLLTVALVVSAYHTYKIRAQVEAGIMGAKDIQERVSRAFKRDGVPPADRQAAGLLYDAAHPVAEYVEWIDVVNGRIALRFGRNADEAITGSVLFLTPFETAALEVVWVCGNQAPGVSLQPLGFMSGSHQATQIMTEIDDRYLPSACR